MDSNEDDFTIRRMEEDDLKGALQCFTSHGLYESLSTLHAFFECDPNAFYVAVSSNENRVIGCCGSPVTTHSSGFLGLYGVDKNYQNRGIGKKLFNLCLKHIGDRNCGLNAVPEKLSMYQNKAGFSVSGGRAMILFEGIPKNLDNLDMTLDNNLKLKQLKQDNQILLSKIISYDSKVHNDNREKLLTLTLNKEDYNTLVIIDETNDQVFGYGCIRPGSLHGLQMLGPVYADNDRIAEVLIYHLIKSSKLSLTNGLSFMTINNPDFGTIIAHKLELVEKENCPTLFTKFIIPANHQFIYCIHSPNFSF